MSSNTPLPKTQTAAVIKNKGAALEIRDDYPVKGADDMAPGECLVKIEASGVYVPFFPP